MKPTPKICHGHTESHSSGLNHSRFWSPGLILKLSPNHPPQSFSKVLRWRTKNFSFNEHILLFLQYMDRTDCFSSFLEHRTHGWLASTERVVRKIWILNIRFRLQQHIPTSNVTRNHGNIRGSREMGVESPVPCLLWFHLPLLFFFIPLLLSFSLLPTSLLL